MGGIQSGGAFGRRPVTDKTVLDGLIPCGCSKDQGKRQGNASSSGHQPAYHIVYGAFAQQGWRIGMEDRFSMYTKDFEANGLVMLSVFDGHGKEENIFRSKGVPSGIVAGYLIALSLQVEQPQRSALPTTLALFSSAESRTMVASCLGN